MCRTSEDPVRHVISFRVNDEEKEVLENLSMLESVSISTLMRDSILLLEDDFLARGKIKMAHKRRKYRRAVDI